MAKKKKAGAGRKATPPRKKKKKAGHKGKAVKRKTAPKKLKKVPRKGKKKSVKKTKKKVGKATPVKKKSPKTEKKKKAKGKAGPAKKKTVAKKTVQKRKKPKAALKKKVKPAKKKVKKAPLKRVKKAPKRAAPAPKKKKRSPPKAKPSARAKALNKALKEDISTVLVTGVFSSVGIFLVQHLLREGFAVVVTDRRSIEIPPAWEKRGVVLRSGNLADPGFMASLLEGVDAVIHTAAHADIKPDAKGLSLSTAIRTRILFQEAKRRGVKRVIHIGSGSVYKRTTAPTTEDGPIEARKEFQQDQIEAERTVLSEASPGFPLVTVIRAASIYGPRCTSQMAAMAALPPLVKTLGPYYLKLSGGPRQNLVHAEDVARASVFLLLNADACGEIFNLGDNDPMAFGDFVNQAMEIYGLKPLKPRVPYPPSTLLQSILPYVKKDEIFNPLTQLSSLLWARMVRKQKLKSMLSPRIDQETLSFAPQDIVLDNRKLLSLGFKLKYPKFPRGWEKTMEWYMNNRWIPRPKDL